MEEKIKKVMDEVQLLRSDVNTKLADINAALLTIRMDLKKLSGTPGLESNEASTAGSTNAKTKHNGQRHPGLKNLAVVADRYDDEGSSDEEKQEEQDTECAVCGADDSENKLIPCSTCPNVFHQDCHDPPLRRAPRGQWVCGDCTSVQGLSQRQQDKKRRAARASKAKLAAAARGKRSSQGRSTRNSRGRTGRSIYVEESDSEDDDDDGSETSNDSRVIWQ